jgi:hypothetical protein
MLQFAQTVTASAFCMIGCFTIVLGNHQVKNYNISRIPMLSTRAKHAIGILMIMIGVLVFLSQFIDRRDGARKLVRAEVGTALNSSLRVPAAPMPAHTQKQPGSDWAAAAPRAGSSPRS